MPVSAVFRLAVCHVQPCVWCTDPRSSRRNATIWQAREYFTHLSSTLKSIAWKRSTWSEISSITVLQVFRRKPEYPTKKNTHSPDTRRASLRQALVKVTVIKAERKYSTENKFSSSSKQEAGKTTCAHYECPSALNKSVLVLGWLISTKTSSDLYRITEAELPQFLVPFSPIRLNGTVMRLCDAWSCFSLQLKLGYRLLHASSWRCCVFTDGLQQTLVGTSR